MKHTFNVPRVFCRNQTDTFGISLLSPDNHKLGRNLNHNVLQLNGKKALENGVEKGESIFYPFSANRGLGGLFILSTTIKLNSNISNLLV